MQHWLSFASPRHGFLGVVIVEAESEREAVAKAISIAPDAAALATGIKGEPVAGCYEPKWLNRLITKPEINEIGERIPTGSGTIHWMITADIKFGNGAIHRCVGRVRNREVVPWTDKADLQAHIAHINDRNPDAGVEIVRTHAE